MCEHQWREIETAPKDGKIDILGKMWAPAFDEFVYQRFPDCFWLREDTMTNRKGDWCGVAKHWRAVAWMPIPALIPPAPPRAEGQQGEAGK